LRWEKPSSILFLPAQVRRNQALWRDLLELLLIAAGRGVWLYHRFFVAAPSATNPRRITFHRMIGLPGDVLDFREAQVTINGRLLVEPDLPEGRERMNLEVTTVAQCRVGPDRSSPTTERWANSRAPN